MILKVEALPPNTVDQTYECSNLPKNGAELVRIRQSAPDDIWLEGVNAAGTDAEKVMWKKPFLLTYPVDPYNEAGSPAFNGYNIEFIDKSGGFRTHHVMNQFILPGVDQDRLPFQGENFSHDD